MPKSVPVPWIQWRRFRITGLIREEESGRPLPGLMVCAFDKDVIKDDYLGENLTDADGRFEIRFTDADFKDAIESRPDLYLYIFVPGHDDPVHDTSYQVRQNATDDEYFDIRIAKADLPDAYRSA
jgi:carotenoid cleavage dioxygenase